MNLCFGGYYAWSGSRTSSIFHQDSSLQSYHTNNIHLYIQMRLEYNSLQHPHSNHLDVSKIKSDQSCLHFRRSLKANTHLLRLTLDSNRFLIFRMVFLSEIEPLRSYDRHQKQQQTDVKFDTHVVKGSRLQEKMLCD